MRYAIPLGLLLLCITACGASHPAVVPVALVAGDSISIDAYQQNLQYALQFYRVAYGPHGGLDKTSCANHSVTCQQLEKQIIRRLLEESVIRQYAQAHHIALSSKDRTQVSVELAQLDQAGSPTSQMVVRKQISRSFVRTLLETELLVRKVENAVVPTHLQERFAYHLRTVAVLIAHGGRGLNAYRRALDLATTGGRIPRHSVTRIEWIALSRLAANLRPSVAAARPGQYVGPFRQASAYLVVQVLGSGIHRYGRTLRTTRALRYFQAWVARRVAGVHAICYGNHRERVACPSPIH